jgi:predicted hotdog family 3-hydroxylacyl-ACP dehydratase
MKLNYPVKTSDFSTWVPHRPPMVWIDEVLAASSEQGECAVHLKPDALYRENGQISPTACIEWVAQAFAYVRSCYLTEADRQGQPKSHEALLVGVKNAKFMFEIGDAEVETAEELRVTVDRFREFGPIIMVHGEVRLPSGRLLMHGNLRVYHGF